MVGQLTLNQHIGVRIPGGQPKTHFPVLPRTFPNFPEHPNNIDFNGFIAILRSRVSQKSLQQPHFSTGIGGGIVGTICGYRTKTTLWG
jgi:hypothetical protein